MLFNDRTTITGGKEQSQQRFASHHYNDAKKVTL